MSGDAPKLVGPFIVEHKCRLDRLFGPQQIPIDPPIEAEAGDMLLLSGEQIGRYGPDGVLIETRSVT